MEKMTAENPQNKNFAISKNFAIAQDVFGAIACILAVIQEITAVIPAKSFLVIAGVILVLEYVSAYYKSSFFDKGHRIREMGLIDNSFKEKRIPNYNSEPYYNNSIILRDEIKLLANIHENSLFTSKIAGKMSFPYYLFSAITFLFFTFKLFISGMDDYSSLLLGFIVSSSLFDRAIKLNSLKNISEEVYEKAYENGMSTSPSLYSIERRKNDTKVTFIQPIYWDWQWLYYSPGFKIIDKKSGDEYNVRGYDGGAPMGRLLAVKGFNHKYIYISLLLPKIIDVLLLYENAVFETKIILSERIFNQLNTSLSKEWLDIRDNYSIYKNQAEMKK